MGADILQAPFPWLGGRRPCAVFFDPPYLQDLRARRLYAEDPPNVAADVREWALEHGSDPDLRIVVCGLEGEHEFPDEWTKVEWTGAKGYGGEGNENRHAERLWFSPHCLPLEPRQGSLFEGAVA